MLVVIDANVLCSALLAKGKTADILFSDRITAIAPELLLAELERHKEELIAKSKLSDQEFVTALALFKRVVTIIPAREFAPYLVEANKLLGSHVKDTAYVALALCYSCPLWSKEKFLRKIGKIEVLTTDELAHRIS